MAKAAARRQEPLITGADPLVGRLPDAAERAMAATLLGVIGAAQAANEPLTISFAGRNDVVLMPSVAELLLRLLKPLASGDAVMILPVDKLLTTQEAADLLNVSRPHLIKLLERGDLPFTTVGRHRRIKFEDALAYRNRRRAERKQALEELSALEEPVL